METRTATAAEQPKQETYRNVTITLGKADLNGYTLKTWTVDGTRFLSRRDAVQYIDRQAHERNMRLLGRCDDESLI